MTEPAESDPAALNSAEDLDEDRLRVDPLEEGVEPPERLSAVSEQGTTPREEREGESLDSRLRQEQRDTEVPEVPERPVAATPATGLDESVDQVTADAEPVAPEEPVPDVRTSAEERGQNADEAGGSMADTLRTPKRRWPDE